MLINRKSRKLTSGPAGNFQTDTQTIQQCMHKELDLVSYPVLEYLLGALLIGLSFYLIYSANGGRNGIKGFRERAWWQYLAALVPMILGICFIVACQIESIIISRKDNWIIATK